MRAARIRMLVAALLAGSLGAAARGQTPLAGVKHGGPVTTLAVAADGKTLASGGADNSVRLWDLATAKELRQLQGHRNRISAVAFSADGKSVASSSLDGSIHIWDAGTGQQRVTMRGHRGAVHAIALAADGRNFASGGEDRRVFVWDQTNGQLTRIFAGHRTGIAALAYAADAKVLASAGGDSVRLWDVPTGRELRQLTVNQEGLRTLAFSADGKMLAAGSKDTIHVWDVASGKLLHQLAGHKGNIHAVAFGSDGQSLASAGEDGAILLWDPASGKHLRVLGRHRGAVNALAFAPNGKTLVSGGEDSALLIWDVSRRFVVPDKPVDLSAQELAGLWNELSGADVIKAYSAMGTLVAGSRHALPYLSERLRAVVPTDSEKKIAQLIAALDDDQFAVREKASSELEKLGPAAATALRLAIEGQLSLEARRRAERILEQLKKPILTPEQLRLQRAVEVLASIGTPEARKVLEEITRGQQGEWLTQEAKSALELLNKRAP